MAALFGSVVVRCVSSICCVSVTALTGLCCSPCLASGYPARNGFVYCGSGHSICFVRSGCFGCHYYFYRFRSGRDLVCSLSSTGIASRVSVGGHWCDDCLCLLVSGPTGGLCRHRICAVQGLTWLRSLYNGRNHFVVTSHHSLWHRSRSRPSRTALFFLTTEILGSCGGGVRLCSRADHRGPHPESRACPNRTAISVLGGLRPGPNFACFGGVWCLCSFLWSTQGRFALGSSGIGCGGF